jgi:hypothetical protein
MQKFIASRLVDLPMGITVSVVGLADVIMMRWRRQALTQPTAGN